jgi:hypothetical protein
MPHLVEEGLELDEDIDEKDLLGEATLAKLATRRSVPAEEETEPTTDTDTETEE